MILQSAQCLGNEAAQLGIGMDIRTNGATAHNALLAALQGDERQVIGPLLEVVQLHRQQVLTEVGQQVEYVYFPHDSVISLTVPTRDGGTAEAATIGREGLVGFLDTLVEPTAFSRTLVQVSGEASRLRLTQMQTIITQVQRVRDLCLRHTQALLGQVLQSVACSSAHSSDERLCRWLLMMQDRARKSDLDLTQDFLAEILGVRRATVSLALGRLANAGIICQKRGLVRVLHRHGLEARSCECYQVVRDYYQRVLPGALL